MTYFSTLQNILANLNKFSIQRKASGGTYYWPKNYIQRKLSTAFEIPFSDLKAEPMMLPAGSDSSFLI